MASRLPPAGGACEDKGTLNSHVTKRSLEEQLEKQAAAREHDSQPAQENIAVVASDQLEARKDWFDGTLLRMERESNKILNNPGLSPRPDYLETVKLVQTLSPRRVTRDSSAAENWSRRKTPNASNSELLTPFDSQTTKFSLPTTDLIDYGMLDGMIPAYILASASERTVFEESLTPGERR